MSIKKEVPCTAATEQDTKNINTQNDITTNGVENQDFIFGIPVSKFCNIFNLMPEAVKLAYYKYLKSISDRL